MGPHGTAGRSADGIFLAFLGIVAQVSDTPEEPEEGEPGPGEGGGHGSDEPDAPLRGWIDPDDRLWRHPSEVAGSGPGTGAVPVLLHAPPHHPYRGAVMVLVGVGAVMAVVAWVIVLLSPASDAAARARPRRTPSPAGRSTTLAGAGERGARRGRRRPGAPWWSCRPRPGTARWRWSASPSPRAGWSPRRPTSSSARDRIDMVGPGGKLAAGLGGGDGQRLRRRAGDVPEDLPVAPFADDAGLDGGTPDLALSFVPAGGASVALHCTPGAVTGVGDGHRQRARRRHAVHHLVPRRAEPSPPASRCSTPTGRSSASSTTPPPAAPAPPPSSRASSSSAWPTTSARRTGSCTAGWGSRGTDAPNGGGAKVAPVQCQRSGRRAPAGGPGDRRRERHAGAHHGRAAGPALRPAPGRRGRLSVQQAAGTKVVDVTLGGSS